MKLLASEDHHVALWWKGKVYETFLHVYPKVQIRRYSIAEKLWALTGYTCETDRRHIKDKPVSKPKRDRDGI